jgi:S1-C subfamily serine protease
MRSRRIAIFLAFVGLYGSYSESANAVQSGTGFAVGDGSSVVTNFHVIDGCKSVRIAHVGDGLIKTVDPANDIAVIQSTRPISGSLRFRTGDPLKPGDDIIVIGFPLRGLLSSAPTVTTGIVSSLAGLRDDRTRFQISAPVQPGNSGGPVLDKAGNVVGMVVSKLNVLRIARITGDIPQNVNFAIPASIITSVLEASSVKYQVEAFDGGKSVAEIVSAAAPGVVSLECQGRVRGALTADVPAAPSPAAAGGYGAIAWDRETGKRGWSWNQPSAQRAAELALSECGATGCKVIMRAARAMCAALATTETGKYVGAARRKDREAARLAALKDCQKGNAGECTARFTECNK